MTTRIHVVNFGPDIVTADRPGQLSEDIYPLSYKDYYVWDGQTVTITEKKPSPPEKAS
jgi:hypothetical protein